MIKYIRDRVVEDGDCLIWTQAVSNSCTPTGTIGRKTVNIRRLVLGDSIRPDQLAVVTCGNPRCLAHLKPMSRTKLNKYNAEQGRLGTIAQQVHNRAVSRSKSTVVRDMGMARLIRSLRSEGLTYREIEERTGVPRSRCCDICTRRAWQEQIAGASVFNLTQLSLAANLRT